MRICPFCGNKRGDWLVLKESRQGNSTRFRIDSPEFPDPKDGIGFGNLSSHDIVSETFAICRWGHMSPFQQSIEPPERPTTHWWTPFLQLDADVDVDKPKVKRSSRTVIVGPVSGGKTQLLRVLTGGDLPLPVWDLAPQDNMTPATLNLRQGHSAWEPEALDPLEDTRATAAADITALRVLQDRISSIYGFPNTEAAITDMVRKLILKEMGQTEETLDSVTRSDLDDRVTNWGLTRVPYELAMEYETSDAVRTSTIQVIDTPGEVVEAAMNPDSPRTAVFRDDVVQLAEATHFLAVIDPVPIPWIADKLKRQCPEALSVSMRQGFGDEQRLHQFQKTSTLLKSFFTASALKEAESAPVTVALTKSDTIRLLLSMADATDPELGRWGSLVPERSRYDFLAGATLALRRYVALMDERHVVFSSSAEDALNHFSPLISENQDRFCASVLKHFGEPDEFWNLVEDGSPDSFSVPGAGSFPLLDHNACWNRFLGGEDVQIRDMVNAVVCGAIISGGFGRAAFARLLSGRFVTFAMTCSRQCCVSKDEVLPVDDYRASPGFNNAGVLQVLLRLSEGVIQ